MPTQGVDQSKGTPGKLGALRFCGLPVILSLVLGACAGGAGSSAGGASGVSSTSGTSLTTQSCSECGSALVSLTDASGPFDTYMVTVDSLKLTRSDGTVVETVPVKTQVDFAQLVDLSEIISAADIPEGRYTTVSLTLDYNGAMIVVDENGTGVPVAAGNILLQSSTTPPTTTPLTPPNSQLTMTLSLGSDNALIVSQGVISNLALDFNLSASNTVGGTAADPTVTVTSPSLTASLVPDPTRQIRVRGALVSVDDTAPASDYVVSVWPFNDMSATLGQVTVDTTDTTTFLVNGTTYTGNNSAGLPAGLEALKALPVGTLTVAYGTFDKTAKTFTASMVLAGSSVPGTAHDSVEGTVIARDASPPSAASNCSTGNVLTVANGIMLHAMQGSMGFARQVTVCVAPVPATAASGAPTGTTVTEDGQTGAFTIADISVGQHLQVSGKFVTPSSGNPILDATSGAARLEVTDLAGSVMNVDSTTNVVTLNLLSLDGLPPAAFDFTGTGASGSDATAAAYTVSVPAALLAGPPPLANGLPARFAGFVTPFGSAPPDFSAQSLVNFAQTKAVLDVRWKTGVPGSSLTLSSTSLAIGQTTLQSAAQHLIQIGPETLDPSTLSGGLQIVPDPSATALQLAIAHHDSWKIDTFSSFADFESALSSDLGTSGTVVLQIAADGPYNTTSGVLSVDQMVVVLNN